MIEEVEDVRKEILDTYKEIKRLRIDAENRLIELRTACPHTLIVETDYVTHFYRNTEPPARICTICGLEESAWWPGGYKILKSEFTKKVSRDEFYTYRELKEL